MLQRWIVPGLVRYVCTAHFDRLPKETISQQDPCRHHERLMTNHGCEDSVHAFDA